MPGAATSGIPIPADEIIAALRSAAVPGYTGVLQLELNVLPEAAAYVRVVVTRRQSKPVQEHTREDVPAVGDYPRKRSVEKAVAELRDKLILRPVLLAVEAHYLDGELKKITIVE